MKNTMRMKKIFNMVLILVILFCGFSAKPITIHAASIAGWSLDIRDLTHNSMSLYVSGVDKAQKATAHILAGNDSFTRELEFTNAIQTFNLSFDKGYDVGTNITVFLKNQDGAITSIKSAKVREDYIDVWGHAYPNVFTGELYANNISSVYATVGFQKYEGSINNSNHTVSIAYPKQAIGTVVQITASDGFCSKTRNIAVENRNIYLPSLSLTRTQMLISYDRIPTGSTVFAKIGDSIYQSPIGDDEYSEKKMILEYPLQNEGQVVSVWMESEDGSSSIPKEYTIKKCDLRLNYGLNAYPRQVSGSVNESYTSIEYVTAQIGKDTYKEKVDSKGNFVIEYPMQKVGSDVIVTGYDEHDCASEPVVTEIENLSYIDTEYNIEHVYASKAIGTSSYDTGVRLCAQIGDTVYYSEYSTIRDQKLEVTYPAQAIGTSAKIWYEEENGCYSDKIKRNVEDKKLYLDKYNLLTGSMDGVISSKISWDIDDIKLKSAEVTINGKTYTGAVKKDSFIISFPKQKLTQKVKLVLVEEDGYTYSENYEIKNIPVKLDFKAIYSDSVKITGTTASKAEVVAKIGDKNYSTTADSSGKFSLDIKKVKAGTNVSLTSTSLDGYYNTKSTQVKARNVEGTAKKGTETNQGTSSKSTSAPQVTETKDQTITVYITRTGSKYHEGWCRYLSKSKIPISLKEAKSSYDPCSVCNPPE